MFILNFKFRAEEKRKREKEEEERRANNEMAFKAWLKLKEEQKVREERLKKKSTKNEENSVSLEKRFESNFIQSKVKKINFKNFLVFNCLL